MPDVKINRSVLFLCPLEKLFFLFIITRDVCQSFVRGYFMADVKPRPLYFVPAWEVILEGIRKISLSQASLSLERWQWETGRVWPRPFIKATQEEGRGNVDAGQIYFSSHFIPDSCPSSAPPLFLHSFLGPFHYWPNASRQPFKVNITLRNQAIHHRVHGSPG